MCLNRIGEYKSGVSKRVFGALKSGSFGYESKPKQKIMWKARENHHIILSLVTMVSINTVFSTGKLCNSECPGAVPGWKICKFYNQTKPLKNNDMKCTNYAQDWKT